MGERVIRIAALCLALASAETLHGIFRATVLAPRFGKKLALRMSIVSGSLIAFAVCLLLVPPLGITEPAGLFALGLGLSAFMASFDIVLGRYLMKRPWPRVLEEFDPRTGNLLLVGLLLLVVFPYLAMRL